jgi:hypothetical protein
VVVEVGPKWLGVLLQTGSERRDLSSVRGSNAAKVSAGNRPRQDHNGIPATTRSVILKFF